MRSLIQSCILVCIILNIQSSRCALRDVFNWKNFTIMMSSGNDRQLLAPRESLEDRDVVPLDFAVWREKLFLSVSSRSPKAPITLTYINLNDSFHTESPKLIPYYPGGKISKLGAQGLKVHIIKNLHVDVCDRLWAIGEENKPTGSTRAWILIWDLKSDVLIRNHSIDGKTTGFAVDVTNKDCNAAFAFILEEVKLTVYDFHNDESWQSNTNLDLIGSQFRQKSCTRASRILKQVTTSDMDFITILAPLSGGHRRILFRSKISEGQYITTSKTIRKKHGADAYDFFWNIGCDTPAESFNSVFDERNAVVFHNADGNGRNISCWNSDKFPAELSSNTSAIFTVNEFDHHLKRMQPDQSGNLWFLFSRYDNQDGKNLMSNGNGINYKISTIPVSKIIKGTVCDAA